MRHLTPEDVVIDICFLLIEKYSMSAPGKLCEHPVNSSKDCQDAADHIDVVYATAYGKGYDLPFGCILDGVDKEKNYLYWNVDGVAGGSLDPNVKQVCYKALVPVNGKIYKITLRVSLLFVIFIDYDIIN